jgi:hypothetical protein
VYRPGEFVGYRHLGGNMDDNGGGVGMKVVTSLKRDIYAG